MKVISALSKFQKSPNTFIPVHMHLRPRTRSQVTIWNLPTEIVLYIFKGLHIKDILNMRLVNPYFRDMINSSSAVWNSVSFQDTWPSASNIKHYEKAADHGNLEALIKLAVAYLYNEGLSGDFEGRKVTSDGVKAAEMFCKIENLTAYTDPFTWLFIRPPWSFNGACCKECVFNYMKDYLKKSEDKSVSVCVAKTLMLLNEEDEEEGQSQADEYLELSVKQKSEIGSYMLWQKKYQKNMQDRAGELASIRELREITKLGHLEAKLTLCKYYACRRFGGIPPEQAAVFVRDFVQSMKPTNTHECFKTSQELTSSMRYILVDWLVEVAGMKDFSSHTLHVAVSVVDRYLKVHKTTRSKLQLLGVAAMVLCSRFLGKDIITIREAAWLTDNTYKYEDVVRMMGEISATLKGNFRVATSLDFIEIFSMLAGLDRKCTCLAEYICELSLLQAEMGQYSPAEIAASSVLLARLLLKLDCPWPCQMYQFSGYSIEDISRCAFHMHEKCFLEGSVVDHRDVTLQAVKLRYSDEKFHQVSEIPIMSYEELCAMLGVMEHILQGSDVRVKFKNSDELILSPSRKKRKFNRFDCMVDTDRDNTATPLLEDKSILNESIVSGYDGDREDEEESFLEYDDSSDLGVGKLEDLDASIGSESDTYFASLSCSNKSSSRTMTINLSFASISPSSNSGISFITSKKYECDNDTTSGISSSPIAGSSGASSNTHASPSSTSRGHHYKLRHTSVDNKQTSDSELDCDTNSSAVGNPAENQGATSYMTLRKTTKRKRMRSLCASNISATTQSEAVKDN